MIFEDLDTLEDIINLIRMEPQGSNAPSGSRFRDFHDPEVDRLFNTSPPISEQAMTLDLDSPLMETQLQVRLCIGCMLSLWHINKNCKDVQNENDEEEEQPKNNKLVTFQKNPIVSVTQAKEELFR